MGILSSIGSAFSSAVSSVGSFFSSAVSGIGSALNSAASYFGSGLSAALSAGGSLLGTVGNVASNLMHGLGLFKKNETLPDMGDRALQAEAQDIKPQHFDNFSQYIDKLRNFELDPEKSKVITQDQKTFKGLEVAGRALEDKYNAPEGGMANVWALAAQSPEFFTSERFESILGSGMDITIIADYFDGKLGAGEALEIEDELVNNDQAAHPGKDETASREGIYAAVEGARNNER